MSGHSALMARLGAIRKSTSGVKSTLVVTAGLAVIAATVLIGMIAE